MKVVIIGAGNLATHLATALQSSGCKILQVFSRTERSASNLASTLKTNYTTNYNEINSNADIYFYLLNDDALEKFVNLNLAPEAIHVHSSGSLSIDIFTKKNCAVLYPLQTFSKERKIDFKQIPICIESSSKEVEEIMLAITKTISNKVSLISSEQRLKLHMAAVFANNFVNYLYSISEEIATNANIDFEIMKPLIFETAEKIKYMSPKDAQTGPAKRKDLTIINKHLELLKNDAEKVKIYELLSKMIGEA